MDQGNYFIPCMNIEYLIHQFAENIIVQHRQGKRSKPVGLVVDLSWFMDSQPWSQCLKRPRGLILYGSLDVIENKSNTSVKYFAILSKRILELKYFWFIFECIYIF